MNCDICEMCVGHKLAYEIKYDTTSKKDGFYEGVLFLYPTLEEQSSGVEDCIDCFKDVRFKCDIGKLSQIDNRQFWNGIVVGEDCHYYAEHLVHDCNCENNLS